MNWNLNIRDRVYFAVLNSKDKRGVREDELVSILKDEGCEVDGDILGHAIQSLIRRKYVRAYFPKGSFGFYVKATS